MQKSKKNDNIKHLKNAFDLPAIPCPYWQLSHSCARLVALGLECYKVVVPRKDLKAFRLDVEVVASLVQVKDETCFGAWKVHFMGMGVQKKAEGRSGSGHFDASK